MENVPAWLPFAISELSASENIGNIECLAEKYLKTCGVGIGVEWCSAFVNWCIEQACLTGTKDIYARSWLGWGKKIKTPEIGCVVVFWKYEKECDLGHTGFYFGAFKDHIVVLGGSQDGKICVKPYPEINLLGYRI